MALNFPPNPSTGDTYQGYTFDGVKWVFTAASVPVGNIPNDTVLGNVSGVPMLATALSRAQMTGLINPFTPTLRGAVPPPGIATPADFILQANGTWAAIDVTDIGPIPSDTVLGNIEPTSEPPAPLTKTELTELVEEFTSTHSGAVPASGGGAVNFLRADRAWTPVLPLAGGDMTGPIELHAAPSANMQVANKGYVDEAIAAQALYQGTWEADTNVPDLTNTALRVNGYAWVALTPNPQQPFVVTAALPGLQGVAVNNGDRIVWSGAAAEFQLVRGSTLSLAEAEQMFVPFSDITIANDTVLGNVSGTAAVATALTPANLTTLINTFTQTLKGAVPAPGAAAPATSVLHANGTWSSIDISGKMDLVSGATVNHLATFNAQGQVIDAGEGVPDISGKMNLVTGATVGRLATFAAGGQVAAINPAQRTEIINAQNSLIPEFILRTPPNAGEFAHIDEIISAASSPTLIRIHSPGTNAAEKEGQGLPPGFQSSQYYTVLRIGTGTSETRLILWEEGDAGPTNATWTLVWNGGLRGEWQRENGANRSWFDNEVANALALPAATSASTLPAYFTATNVKTAIDQLVAHNAMLARRTANITLNFTTDNLSGTDTLARLIDRRLQDNTLFVSSSTFYTLTINIDPGTITNATCRLNGLRMRAAYVDLNINNGVILADVVALYNDVGRLVINCNAERINGSVRIEGTQARFGNIEFNWNSPTTVAPAAPRQRLHSVITGGVIMVNNIAAVDLIYRQGGLTELGIVDEHGRVNAGTAPAVGTLAPGVININQNRALSVWGRLYANYSEKPIDNLDYSDLPGAFVANTIYVYYNFCCGDCNFNVEGGWIPGTEPTFQNLYVAYNHCGRSTYAACGTTFAANSFANSFTATALADNSTASRNTFQITTDRTAAQEAIIVGMGCTFTNAAATSSAANYTGTFKSVTAYDPATRTVTLSGTFALPRPVDATVRFFAYAGNTRMIYGTNAKIERMLLYAHAHNYPCGLLNIDGNNLSSGLRITAVDTVNKIVTFQRADTAGGLWSNTTSDGSTFIVCTLTGSKNVADVTFVAAKHAAHGLRGNADLKTQIDLDQRVVGCKITGSIIDTGISREITAASWVTNNLLQIEHDGADTSQPVNTTVTHSMVIRRVPGRGTVYNGYNFVGGSAYAQTGHWGYGVNGGQDLGYISLRANVATSNYIVFNNYFGTNPNPGSGIKAIRALIYETVSSRACELDARCNSQNGAGGFFGSVEMFLNKSNDDMYIRLSPRFRITRNLNCYRNQSQMRFLIRESATISGTTITRDTAPLIEGNVNCYDLIAPLIHFNSLNVVTAPLAESGQNLVAYGFRVISCIASTCYIESANFWVDVTNSVAATVAAPVSAIQIHNTHNFVFGGTGRQSIVAPFAPSVLTVPAANKFAIDIMNSNGFFLRSLPDGSSQTILARGYVTGSVLASIVNPQTHFYRAQPETGTVTSLPAGIGSDVNLWHNHSILGAP